MNGMLTTESILRLNHGMVVLFTYLNLGSFCWQSFWGNWEGLKGSDEIDTGT